MFTSFASCFYFAVAILSVPCFGSKSIRRHEFRSRSTAPADEKKPAPPPGSPAWIRQNPPPPLCTAESKVNVYVGKDNRRTLTTSEGFFSDEASRNAVRCKGSLPSEKCLPLALRANDQADTDTAPGPMLLLSRNKGSLQSIMMDAVEGPLPANQVPMESHISGFGGNVEATTTKPATLQPEKPALKAAEFTKSGDFAIQPPNPSLKEPVVEVKKPDIKVTDASSASANNPTPTHPASKTLQVPKEPPVVPVKTAPEHAQTGTPAPHQIQPHQHQQASGGSLSPNAAAAAAAANAPKASFHTSDPCSGIKQEKCPCVQDNDLPLLWKPHQQVVDMVQEISLAVPEQKDRDLKKDPLHILIVGVGTGSLSMSVLNNCRVFVPGGLRVESVEPDGTTMTVAQQLFGFQGIAAVHKVEVNQCGNALAARQGGNAENGGKYDVVVLNVFNGDSTVPTQCRNQTFLGQVKNVLKDQGMLMNIVHDKQLKEVLTDYTEVFGYKVRKDQVKAAGEPTNYWVISAGDLDLAKSGAAWPQLTGFVAIMLASLVAF